MNYGWRFMTLYKRLGSRPSPRKRNAKRQNGCLRRPYKQRPPIEKRREAKGKREKERYTHLNVEFKRIARRDKKAFLSDQSKKQRKTIEWKSLEISSRKLETPRKHFMQDEHNKGQK